VSKRYLYLKFINNEGVNIIKKVIKDEILKMAERLVAINENEKLTHEEDILILSAVIAVYESIGQ
jgi:hypothetical protein